MKLLVLIPARAGSKRVPGKNTKDFLGKPLIAYTIEQALACPFVDRVIVDTDSEEIAKIAKEYGAEVPWLRPKELAMDSSKVLDSILYNVEQLEKKEKYIPSHIMLLQTTSPLRDLEDIEVCWNLMLEGGANTTVSVFNTNIRPVDLVVLKNNFVQPDLLDVSGIENEVIYAYNGFVYIMEREALLKERKILMSKTKVTKCPLWRGVDINTFEDWALAEFMYQNKEKIAERIEKLEGLS